MLASSASPLAERRVGLEIERVALWPDGGTMHYVDERQGSESRPGAGTLLGELHSRHGWKPKIGPGGQLLGLSGPFGEISLEPGSQLEISTAPSADLFSQIEILGGVEKAVGEITGPWGVRWLGLGVNPTCRLADTDVIPAPRYAIMTDYLGRRDTLGLRMMRFTTSIQVNLDYGGDGEAVEMLRAALAAAPISYALFANSPFSEGKETGFLSYRAEIWRRTDPDRSGLLPEAFAPGFDLQAYARHCWNEPLMYAVRDDGAYVAAKGLSSAAIERGEFPGVTAGSRDNLTNGVRQIFTEARLKPGYVEVRSLDGLPPRIRYAAAAFWVGLLYGRDARAAVLDRLGGLAADARHELWVRASREGLRARFGGGSLADTAGALLSQARASLVARGRGEEKLLEPIEEILDRGKNPAELLLERFHGPWGERVEPVIEELGVVA